MSFPIALSRGKKSGTATRYTRFRLVALCTMILAVTGCTRMPVKEGATARLLPGIHAPRDRNNMDITIHRIPVTAWPKCLEFIGRKSPFMAVASAVTLTVYHACARVPRDRRIKAGQRPWCTVAVPDGDEEALEHELRHCEGWDHPTEPQLDYANDGDGDSDDDAPFAVSGNTDSR